MGDTTSFYKPLYKYEIATGQWIRIEFIGKQVESVQNNGLCIYKNTMYSVLGSFSSSSSVYKIDLKSGNYELEDIYIDSDGMADSGFGYACKDNMIFIFGGSTYTGKHNNLAVLDFDKLPLKFTILSKQFKTPTARRGHAMELYNNKLYIYGGITNEAIK